jgi:hypothetical protein
MKIAKTNYRPDNLSSTKPAAASPDFLDVKVDPPSPEGAGIVTNLLDRMAEYVAPPDQAELEEVANDLSENFKSVFGMNDTGSSSKGRKFMDILTQDYSPDPQVDEAKASTGLLGIKDQVTKLLAQLTGSGEATSVPSENEIESPRKLYAETTMVPVTALDDVKEIKTTINQMEAAIAAFQRSEADELPLAAEEQAEVPKTKAEKLLQEMQKRKPIWKEDADTAPPSSSEIFQMQSLKLIEKIQDKIGGISKLTGVPDVLNSQRSTEDLPPARISRVSKLQVIAQEIDPEIAESLMSSKLISPKGISEASASVIEEDPSAQESSFRDKEGEDPEIIELNSPSFAATFPVLPPPSWSARMNSESSSLQHTEGSRENSGEFADTPKQAEENISKKETEYMPKITHLDLSGPVGSEAKPEVQHGDSLLSDPSLDQGIVSEPTSPVPAGRRDRKRLSNMFTLKDVTVSENPPGSS